MNRQRTFKLLHGLLALIAIVLTAILVSSEGGHPPAIILAPVVWVAWILGHAFLWLIHRTIRQSDERSAETGSNRWPLPILLIFLLSAVSLFIQLNGIGWSLAMSNERISSDD